MKRKLHLISLLIACIGMSSVSFAQTWDAPSPKGSVPVSGTAYYVYNIGKHGFLNRGGNWGTQAVATPSPYQWTDNTTLVKWTAVNTSGSTWTFQYNLGGNNVGNHYLFAADPGNGNVYTDNSLNTHYWVLDLVDASKNIYTLQVPSSYGGYNAEQFLGVESAAEETNRGYTNLVRYNKPSGDDYTKWVFLSQEDYDLYLAKVTLDRYMTYAQMIGEIDLTSYITTYNADVIADINTAANNLYTALNPTDVTSYITNPSFESAFSGWINNGFASQNSGGLIPIKMEMFLLKNG